MRGRFPVEPLSSLCQVWRQHGDAVSAGHGRPSPGGVVSRRAASRIPTEKARRVRRRNFCNPAMRARGKIRRLSSISCLPEVGSSLNFCMVPFEAGKLQFNETLSFCSTSKPFSAWTFPLNCNKEPFCNIHNRFEAERTFAEISARSTIFDSKTAVSLPFLTLSIPARRGMSADFL